VHRCDGSGKSHDSDKRHFEGLEITTPIAPTPVIDAMSTPELRAEAARQWADIPTHPTELRKWMRGEPINSEAKP
jgi:hypothetical protein